MNETRTATLIPTSALPPAIPEERMQHLVARGDFAVYVAYIGGQGDVGIAEPRNGRGGPRYWFHNMRRLWLPIPEPQTPQGGPSDGYR